MATTPTGTASAVPARGDAQKWLPHAVRLIGTAITLVLGLPQLTAHAASYPDHPIKVVIPFPAGGATDVLGRIVLEKAAGDLGQAIIIENQAGAAGNVGTAAVARAEPDGYRLILSGSGPLAANRTLMKSLSYDPQVDLAPITLMASMPNIVVVGKAVPVNSLTDLIAYVKARPGQINYSSIGNGSSQHLAGVFFEQLTGTKMTHVPYRAAGQLATDLVSGIVPLSFQLIPNILGQLQSGDLKPLAVMADRRSPSQPGVPTTAELGFPGFVSAGWFGLLAPKGTPREIIDRVHDAVVGAMADKGIERRLVEAGIDPVTSTPEQFAAHIAAEIAKWRDIITKGGVTAD